MKKICKFILTASLMLAIVGCNKSNIGNNSSLDTNVTDTTNNLTVEDVKQLFQIKNKDVEIIDCVLSADQAYDMAGVLLYEERQEFNENDVVTYVVFVRKDGVCSKTGVMAKVWPESEFSYKGNGTVSFRVDAGDGKSYRQVISVSIDGPDVKFVSKSEDL